MLPDWKLELQSREPAEHAESLQQDPAVEQRITLMQRAQMYEQSATKWCLQAGEEHEKAKRLRREARVAEILVALLIAFVLYLVKK